MIINSDKNSIERTEFFMYFVLKYITSASEDKIIMYHFIDEFDLLITSFSISIFVKSFIIQNLLI